MDVLMYLQQSLAHSATGSTMQNVQATLHVLRQHASCQLTLGKKLQHTGQKPDNLGASMCKLESTVGPFALTLCDIQMLLLGICNWCLLDTAFSCPEP